MAGIWESLYWGFTGKDWRIEKMNREQEREHAEGQLVPAAWQGHGDGDLTVWGVIKTVLTICSALFICFLFFVGAVLICRYFHIE